MDAMLSASARQACALQVALLSGMDACELVHSAVETTAKLAVGSTHCTVREAVGSANVPRLKLAQEPAQLDQEES